MRRDDPDDGERPRRWASKYCTGMRMPTGMMSRPTSRSALAGLGGRAGRNRRPRTGGRQRRSEPGDGADHAALERVETESVLDVQVAEHAPVNRLNPSATKPISTVRKVPDLLQASERRLDRHRRLVWSSSMTSPRTRTHLLLAATRLGDPEREEGEDQRPGCRGGSTPIAIPRRRRRRTRCHRRGAG